jgi:hypothetical protein
MTGRMTETEFARKFEEFGRSKNMPLKDILTHRDAIAQRVLHKCACEKKTDAEKEQLLWLYFVGFSSQFGPALPPGTRPLAEADDSE